MVAAVTAIGGLVALCSSVLLVAWQAREVARQTRLNTMALTVTLIHDNAVHWNDFQAALIAHPELRGYFYQGKACPEEEVQRSRVLTIAEVLADKLDPPLRILQDDPFAGDDFSNMREMSRSIMSTSPALTELVEHHPDWWPGLAKLLTHPPEPAPRRPSPPRHSSPPAAPAA